MSKLKTAKEAAKIYYDAEGNECSIMQMVKSEPFGQQVKFKQAKKLLRNLKL